MIASTRPARAEEDGRIVRLADGYNLKASLVCHRYVWMIDGFEPAQSLVEGRLSRCHGVPEALLSS